jgi:hypothetical protein
LQFLTDAKTWQATTADYQSLEEFWVDVISAGRAFLAVPEWKDTLTKYNGYVADLTDEKMKVFAPKRQLPGTDTYWQYVLAMKGLD